MEIFGDFHTHTTDSDGRGSVAKNLAKAIGRNLKYLSISDHGFTSIILHNSKKKLARQAVEIDRLNEISPVKIFKSLEANLIGYDGKLDVDEETLKKLDVVMFGFHRFINPRHDGQYFEFCIKNGYMSEAVRRELEPKCTAAYLKVIETYPIDTICHPLSRTIIDVKRICEAAVVNNCYLELNEKHIHSLENDIDAALKTKVKFIMGSDAHRVKDVGKFTRVREFIERHNIPFERIVGVGLEPKFKGENKY